MAVIQKKWQEMTILNSLITSDILELAEDLDEELNTKYDFGSNVEGLLNVIKNQFFTTANPNCTWKDLPIFMSSFKEYDSRILLTLQDRLKKYIRFYTKMVVDDGLARQMSIDRGFSNSSSDSDTNRNYVSDTPQEELDNFETAIIKYASSLTKDTRSRSGSQSGTSYERAKNTSWDEGMKNLRLVFYNDLVDFIASLPNIVYNYYCLDSRPYPALVKEYYKGMFNAFRI